MRTRKPPESSASGAFDCAARLLARREHSATELRHKLARRGFDAAHVEAALQRLRELGWQDDARYAAARTASRVSGGMGPLKLRAELQAAGIDEAAAQRAMAEVDWRECIRAVHRRRFGRPPVDAREWQKQYRFLLGRGFRAEDIHAVLREVPDEDGDPTDR